MSKPDNATPFPRPRGERDTAPRGGEPSAENLAYLEQLYGDWSRAPEALDEGWDDWFQRLPATPATPLPPPPTTPPSPAAPSPASAPPESPCGPMVDAAAKQGAVFRLINAYRVRGHQNADLEPFELRPRPAVDELDPAYHDLTEADLDRAFDSGSLATGEHTTLRRIIALLRASYTGPVGAEYMHLTETLEKRWLQQRLEAPRPLLASESRRRILERIAAAEGLERFLHTKYVGQKRFSLEGGEVLIPALDRLVQAAGASGTREMVIGMAHRGRLNVLINLLGKSPHELFQEFEGTAAMRGAGDVKYHLGYSTDVATPGGPLHLALAFNPSHLEIVGPVVEGSVRARQQRRDDHSGKRVLPVLIHGDSAFAGQGVVMETLQMSQARGYTTGGTLHIVVNNQIGFTTSNPLDTRSSLYCTDVAKMVRAPILHVNGDEPEAVNFVVQLALEYREAFHKDVVVDLLCYRRHGHNEADEPAVTQPMMYRRIRNHPTLLQRYGERLAAEEVIEADGAERLAEEYRRRLEADEIVARDITAPNGDPYRVDWSPFQQPTRWDAAVETAVSLPHLQQVAERLLQLPAGFELHPRVRKIAEDRARMAAGALAVDWGFAELLAYGTLLMEGYEVRLSGQDAGRGTFFHRHAVLHNQVDGSAYTPLQHLSPGQPHFVAIDSLLSEEAVLAFEYGYASAEPRALVIWEAQFGDFANNAQVVIDQFISSGEAKWGRLCGLTLFLPHGFEGQGAEHSSARLERYLQLCAEENIQVCVPSTPAQLFHLLRRQMLRPLRKPLVVITPKSLLRNPASLSPLEAFYQGRFQPVIEEADALEREGVRRVLLCSGKLYYDLLAARRERSRDEIAILRIEQLYPFPEKSLRNQLKRYPNALDVAWCQEEPRNQGAWYTSRHHLRAALAEGQRLRHLGRPSAAAPAVGSFRLHVQQQQALVDEALAAVEESSE
ncbi:2-oxoglutarate dehydrogenase E1 component [Endothiovibrio diazotrophicus]